uniref:Uncharacterized protein n=1 Tax=Lates calcarifer TaxID=8187 RepID=A0A4W6DJ55_LATCA
MSAASCLLSEDEFLCSICLDVFTDPVTTPCGHNYCKNCINQHWNTADQYLCPVCKKVFNTRPELHINTFISEMVAKFRKLNKSTQQKASSSSSEMCTKHDKPLELFCKTDQTCVCMLCSVLDHRTHEFVPVKEEYEGMKAELEKTEAEIQQRESRRSHKGDGRETENHRETVDVTLDPDTAHPNLVLSDDEKQVHCGDVKKNLPDNPERFKSYISVLGKQSFSSGRFYFEVQVKEKTKWTLGVARESIKRRGKITLSPQRGYWAIWLRNGNEYKTCDVPPVDLSLKSGPEKVGVFVDYEEGLVSFYDVDTGALIYSFTGCSFTEKLYPYYMCVHCL